MRGLGLLAGLPVLSHLLQKGRVALSARPDGCARYPQRPSYSLFLTPGWRGCQNLRRLCGVAYLLSTEGWTD